VEHAINIPGIRLDEARRAYERETDPERKRVAGAMLAGTLFNRAADIFTKVVELQEAGVEITSNDALIHQCGQCLQEALELGAWSATVAATRVWTSSGASPSLRRCR